jgi:Ras-related protein Rab-4B
MLTVLVVVLLLLMSLSRESYNHLSTWLEDARTLASAGIVIILVGNKKDLEDEREVTFIEASRFAQENSTLHSFPPRLLARRRYIAAPSLSLSLSFVSRFLASFALLSSDLMFLETSALTGDNVEEVFLKCARSIFSKVEVRPTRVAARVCRCLSPSTTVQVRWCDGANG